MGRKGAQARERNPQWKGGRVIASNGYVLVRVGTDHHLADVRGYAYEHRVVAERKLGRRLRDDEEVHHLDRDKQNNAEANLEVVTSGEHRVRHRSPGNRDRLRKPGESNPTVFCACGCGEAFDLYDGSGRPRKYVTGHNPQEAKRREMVVRALADGPKSRAELATIVGTSVGAIACALSQLRRVRRAEPVGRGVWRATA